MRLLLLPTPLHPISGPQPSKIPTSPLNSVPLQSNNALFEEDTNQKPTFRLAMTDAAAKRLPFEECNSTPVSLPDASKLLRRQFWAFSSFIPTWLLMSAWKLKTKLL